MSQPGDSSGWLPWILGGAGLATFAAIVWKALKQIFSYVTREELAEIIAAQDVKFTEAMQQQRAEILRLHGQNGAVNTAIFERLREQDKGLARIEGRIEGALSGH